MTASTATDPGWVEELEALGTEATKRILDMARSEGVGVATREALRVEPRLVRALSSTGRADWRFHLPAHGHERVLVLGSGLGGTAFDLVEDYGEVVSCEMSPDAVSWQRLWAAESSVKRIRILQASPSEVPLPDSTADLVALDRGVNRGLVSGRRGDLRRNLASILGEAGRVLRPGGWVYWGIENRGVVPPGRRIGDLARPLRMKIARRDIAELLGRAGFGHPTFFWVRPNCQEQISSGPLDDPRMILELGRTQDIHDGRALLRRLGLEIAGRTRLYRPLVPHLLVFAQLGATRGSEDGAP